MTVTAREAELLIAKAQNANTIKFYEDSPSYLEASRYQAARTMDDIRASVSDNTEVSWGESVDDNTVVDGHTVSHEASFGGEGQGDYAYEIYKIDEQLFRKEGYYTSYEGTSWDEGNFEEVETYVVPVTKYRKVSR